jgi:hypothetical protein
MMRLHPEQERSSHGNQMAPLQWWHRLRNPSGNPWTEITVNQNSPVTGTVYAHLCPLPPVLCLLKPTAHVCTPKMAEDELSGRSASSHSMSWVNKPPFSAFTRPLFLVVGAGGRTWHRESQEFGPWVQTSSFKSSHPWAIQGPFSKGLLGAHWMLSLTNHWSWTMFCSSPRCLLSVCP